MPKGQDLEKCSGHKSCKIAGLTKSEADEGGLARPTSMITSGRIVQASSRLPPHLRQSLRGLPYRSRRPARPRRKRLGSRQPGNQATRRRDIRVKPDRSHQADTPSPHRCLVVHRALVAMASSEVQANFEKSLVGTSPVIGVDGRDSRK